LVVITGVGTGLASSALMLLLRLVQRLAWPAGPGDFMAHVAQASMGWRIAVLILAGLTAGIGRSFLRRPNTKGHAGDLSEVIWLHDAKVAVAPTVASAILSMTIVGLGASLGREGALKQAGAAIGAQFSAWKKVTPQQRRLLVACGAGAGMGAAYNVPFGGALFVMEVLLGTVSLPAVLPALVTSIIATIVSWLFLPNKPTYQISHFDLPPTLMVWALVAGPVLGLASAGYIKLIAWADSHRPIGREVVIAPALVFALLGLAAVLFPQILGNGKDLIQQLLSGQTKPALFSPLLILKMAAIAGCLAAGAPGGLFTPTMTCGALLGALLGWAWLFIWPGAAPVSFALIGAGAVLAASTQAPVSSVVLLVELTHRVDSMVVPVLIAIAGAMLTTRALEHRSIYTARILPKRQPR
jgi:H+/Cl- antiporter ClcA